MNDQQKNEALQLLHDYNRWRAQTGNIAEKRRQGIWLGGPIKAQRVRNGKVIEDRLPLFAQTAAWCKERGIDPRLWIYLLFRARLWTFPPQLNASHLMSEKMIGRYEQLAKRSLDCYRTELQYEHEAKMGGRPFDPHRDISKGNEILKRRYLDMNQSERCMRETLERTFGFHPKSDVCTICPLRLSCERQLRDLVPAFDIVALRRGEISVDAARALAASVEKTVG